METATQPMIKASELRIGNWIVFDGTQLKATSNIIHSLDEEWFSAEPIPLTPEILEKCGFDCGFSGYKKDGFAFTIWHNGKEGQDKDSFIIQDNVTQCELTTIKYLHQLQNLIFALTGTELEISL